MYPKRKFCFLGDNLYAVKPILKLILKYGWHFIMTAKPDRNKGLFRNFEVLGETRNTLSVTGEKGHRHEYIWANAIPLTQEYHEKDFFHVNFVEYFEYDEKGKRIYHSSWITDLSITKSNVQEIAKGGVSMNKKEMGIGLITISDTEGISRLSSMVLFRLRT